MKGWFVLIEVALGAASAVSYLYAENMLLTAITFGLMILVGVGKPLLAARQRARVQAYTSKQYDKAEEQLDATVKAQLEGAIEPPLPVRGVIETWSKQRCQDPAGVLEAYDALAQASDDQWAAAAATFAERAGNDSSVGLYALGLAQLKVKQHERAAELFAQATAAEPSWVYPAYGHMTAEFRRFNLTEIAAINPQINGTEIGVLRPGTDEEHAPGSYMDALSEQFQAVMGGMGGVYAAAEMLKSKAHMQEQRREYEAL